MKTFLELVLAGEVQREAIDDFINQWHDGEVACSLAEFLGLSDDEYALWVEQLTALELIIQAHTAGLRLEKIDANVA